MLDRLQPVDGRLDFYNPDNREKTFSDMLSELKPRDGKLCRFCKRLTSHWSRAGLLYGWLVGCLFVNLSPFKIVLYTRKWLMTAS